MSKNDDVTALSSQRMAICCAPDFNPGQTFLKFRTAILSVKSEKKPRVVELAVFKFQEQDAKCIPIIVTN